MAIWPKADDSHFCGIGILPMNHWLEANATAQIVSHDWRGRRIWIFRLQLQRPSIPIRETKAAKNRRTPKRGRHSGLISRPALWGAAGLRRFGYKEPLAAPLLYNPRSLSRLTVSRIIW